MIIFVKSVMIWIITFIKWTYDIFIREEVYTFLNFVIIFVSQRREISQNCEILEFRVFDFFLKYWSLYTYQNIAAIFATSCIFFFEQNFFVIEIIIKRAFIVFASREFIISPFCSFFSVFFVNFDNFSINESTTSIKIDSDITFLVSNVGIKI